MNVDWTIITWQALQNLWQSFLGFVPKLLIAVIVFLIGWFIAIAIGKVVAEILKRLRFNRLFEKGTWKAALEKAEFKIDASEFIGAIFKWVFIIVFLQVAVGILGWTQFAGLLAKVIGYLPNVIVAALIFVVAVIVADIVEKIVVAAAEGAKFAYTRLAGTIVKWAIWVFAILAILRQLIIVPELVDILFGAIIYGVVALVVISFGIAFGLGGKEVAAEILQGLKRKLKS